MSKIADIDFATTTLGSFRPEEQELTKGIGRKLDLIFISHPATVHAWFSELQDFVTRSSRNLFLTTQYALSSLSELGTSEGDFIARHSSRVMYVYPQAGPPHPSRPLHCEHGNSLAVLIPLLLLRRPKRIFIFGADGGSNPVFNKRPYFYNDDIDLDQPQQEFSQRPKIVSTKGRPEQLREGNRRMRADAINADRVIKWALQVLNVVFDVPIPPIFNVCPHSTHAVFPRIDCDTAISMLRN